MRLSELEALIAVRHLTEAVRAEVETLSGQSCGSSVESVTSRLSGDSRGRGGCRRWAHWGGRDGVFSGR
jgi:hypothetical protein